MSPRRLAAIATILFVFAAGCSSGTQEPGAQGEPDLETYCARALEIETAVPDFQANTEEESMRLMRTFAAENFKPQSEAALRALGGAGDELLESAEIFYWNLIGIASDGDYSVLDEPGHNRASGVVHAFDLESCGWNPVEVIADEYSFVGVPESLEAGPASFDFDNVGGEVHEATIFKVKPGAAKPLKELVDLGPAHPEVVAGLEFLGNLELRPVGTPDDYAILDLEAGSYAIVCYYPVGATPEKVDDPATNFGGAERHYSRGMISEFTVG